MDLSYRAQIMSKDVAVATVAGNAVTPVREDLLPLFFKRSSSFEDWLRTRAIDIHRTNSRLSIQSSINPVFSRNIAY